MVTQQLQTINGIDLDALQRLAGEVAQGSEKSHAKFQVSTVWLGGPRSATRVDSYDLGNRKIPKNFVIHADEPEELLGTNTAPNPQELLMAAFNACIMVGYVALSSLQGIELEKLKIETEGELDLRGFFGIDPDIKPGYNEMHYTVSIKGNGTAEQFAEIHDAVMATSPNFWNITQPITVKPVLRIE